MKSKLFLTGESGCGKSTLLLQELGKSLAEAGGFLTVRKKTEDGRILGFDLITPDGTKEQRFLDFTKKPPIRMEVFQCLGVWCLEHTTEYSFVVLDEIGGIELLDEDFSRAIYDFFNCDVPCIGVVKGNGPASGMIQALGLSERYEQERKRLWHTLESMEQVQVVEMSGWDDVHAKQAVQQWIQKYGRRDMC